MVEQGSKPDLEPQPTAKDGVDALKIWNAVENDPAFVEGMSQAQAEHDSVGFEPFVGRVPGEHVDTPKPQKDPYKWGFFSGVERFILGHHRD